MAKLFGKLLAERMKVRERPENQGGIGGSFLAS